MLLLKSSVLCIPLAASKDCPIPSYFYTVTKEQCETQGCKCDLRSDDPTKCQHCGECSSDTDCPESQPFCGLGFPLGGSACVECVHYSGDCPSSKPVCANHQCSATCSTSNYQCKAGVRVDSKNDNACSDGDCDSQCCGQCDGDSDCIDPSSPHCLLDAPDPATHLYLTDLGQCQECTSIDHCDDKSICFGGKCSPCRAGYLPVTDQATCLGPCVAGRYECQLPCSQDSDCRVEEGEVCALNPGEADITSEAKRCQMPCSSNQDCFPGDTYFHTCLEVDGRKFCGQCLEDSHCSIGQTCQFTLISSPGDELGHCVDSFELSEASV